MSNNFLKNLTRSVEEILTEVLAADAYTLFKRSARVVSGVPFSPSSTDYHLVFVGQEWSSREQGTFRCEDGKGASLVLRNPSRIRVTYQLLAAQGAVTSRLEAWDRLVAFFFDNPVRDPILPEALKEIPGLYDRLNQEKAVFALLPPVAPTNVLSGQEPVHLSFQYSALYHSGAVLNKESLVKQRVIEYRERERSTP